MGMIAGIYPKISAMPKLLIGGKLGMIGHTLMSRYVRHFLEAYLKKSSLSLDYIKKHPQENGAPKDFTTYQFNK